MQWRRPPHTTYSRLILGASMDHFCSVRTYQYIGQARGSKFIRPRPMCPQTFSRTIRPLDDMSFGRWVLVRTLHTGMGGGCAHLMRAICEVWWAKLGFLQVAVANTHCLKPNSWIYNFVEVSRHNLESSQTWGFCMNFLNHREGMVFYQVFLLSPLQCTATEL